MMKIYYFLYNDKFIYFAKRTEEKSFEPNKK